MHRSLCSLLLAASLSLLSAPAFAQGHVKELTFEDDNVEGELLAPSHDLFVGAQDDPTTSLIKVRQDFIDLTIKSAEGL
jgi:hypothetical protein